MDPKEKFDECLHRMDFGEPESEPYHDRLGVETVAEVDPDESREPSGRLEAAVMYSAQRPHADVDMGFVRGMVYRPTEADMAER